MKVLLASLALGLSALLTAPRAHAWAEFNFAVDGVSQGHSVVLKCEANYAAPCTKGMTSNYVQGWNPLDGNRWSKYRLVLDGQTLLVDMYDTRQACPVGAGWKRGWLWELFVIGPKKEKLGPYKICTRHSTWDSKETLSMHVMWRGGSVNRYDIDFLRRGDWQDPAAWVVFDPAKGTMTGFQILYDRGDRY